MDPQTNRFEHKGIDLLDDDERRGTPRDLCWLWAGTNLTVQSVLFGSLLPFLGLSFAQCVTLIVIGNLGWVLVGWASVQGPAAGTSIFAITRASFGVRGGRVPALLNWVTQILWETLGLAVIALAVLALLTGRGPADTHPLVIVAVVTGASVVQLTLPLLGHAAIMRALRWLTVPFLVSFVVLAALTVPHVDLDAPAGGGSAIAAGIALMSAVSMAWVVNASDYSRYLPASTSRPAIVTAVSVGGYLSATPTMILGAAIASIPGFDGDLISGLPTLFPAAFVVPYLIFVIVQNYAVNSIDLYSSGLSLQAAGLPLRRWQAVGIDCVLAAVLATAALLSPSLNAAVSGFVVFAMAWIAPWFAIFIVDWVLRRGAPHRYDREALFHSGVGPYRGRNGFRPAGLVALASGITGSALFLSTPIVEGPLASAAGGVDASVPTGLLVGGVVYWLLSRRAVRRETLALLAAGARPGHVAESPAVVA